MAGAVAPSGAVMSGTSSTTPPLDGCDWTPTPEQERAYAEIGAALPLLQLAQNMEHEAFTREEGTEVTDPLRTAAQALLPCPFCGSEPMEHAIEPHSHALRVGEFKMPDHHGSHVIECACGAGLIDDTRDAVASRWNKRAALAAPQLADDELEAAPAVDAVPPAQGMPDAGHPLLQRLVNSIVVEDGLPWWNYSDMYAVRDALVSIAALQADLAHSHKKRLEAEAGREAGERAALQARVAELERAANVSWIQNEFCGLPPEGSSWMSFLSMCQKRRRYSGLSISAAWRLPEASPSKPEGGE